MQESWAIRCMHVCNMKKFYMVAGHIYDVIIVVYVLWFIVTESHSDDYEACNNRLLKGT